MFAFFSKNKTSFSTKTLAIGGLIAVAFGYAILTANSRILEQGFESMTQVYIRVFIGFLLSLLIFSKHIRIKAVTSTSPKDWFWLIIMGTVGYSITVWLMTLASLNTKLVNGSVIFGCAPFVVYAYSYFLLKEKIKPKLILYLFLALYGITIIASKALIPQFSDFGTGEVFAVLSTLTSGWWSIGRKKLSDHLNNREITSLTMGIAAATGVIIALLRGESFTLASFGVPAIILGLVIGAVLNVCLTFLENFSFKHLSPVFGNQILMTSTLFSLALGFIFYGEVITLMEVVGAAIITTSVWQANKVLS